MESPGNDGGQAVILLLAVVAMAAMTVVGIGRFSERIVDRGRAQTAADAAALAGAAGGRSAAARLAASNGAELISYAVTGDVVAVVVDVDGERATARATDGP